MATISIETTDRTEGLDVTEEVTRALPDNADGVATVFVRRVTGRAPGRYRSK
ncbi:hypothetical protein [Halapricum desulfuricans]|uniref:Uncharacterized protein n=1 Tax=Halapricum desulfuricans TaxID=2841257 RepID=A0A897NIM4_9EURY|nr:hypothetical protein [Halapricum desulfuricans]QSG08289.1 Uncharacterized protein HSR122_0885 [Halapricum desulfuricans]QSG12597.1 Uncharacterized protein HSBGL_2190 [Halapricum desulfuricans]